MTIFSIENQLVTGRWLGTAMGHLEAVETSQLGSSCMPRRVRREFVESWLGEMDCGLWRWTTWLENHGKSRKYRCDRVKKSQWRGKKDCAAQQAKTGNHSPQAEKRGPCTPYIGQPSTNNDWERSWEGPKSKKRSLEAKADWIDWQYESE